MIKRGLDAIQVLGMMSFFIAFLPVAWCVGLACWLLNKCGIGENLFGIEIE